MRRAVVWLHSLVPTPSFTATWKPTRVPAGRPETRVWASGVGSAFVNVLPPSIEKRQRYVLALAFPVPGATRSEAAALSATWPCVVVSSAVRISRWGTKVLKSLIPAEAAMLAAFSGELSQRICTQLLSLTRLL